MWHLVNEALGIRLQLEHLGQLQIVIQNESGPSPAHYAGMVKLVSDDVMELYLDWCVIIVLQTSSSHPDAQKHYSEHNTTLWLLNPVKDS